jgi:hypothetical protein
MNNQNFTITELVQSAGWKSFTKKLELFSYLFFIIVIFLISIDYSNTDLISMLLTVSATTLSIVYFFSSFIPYKSDSKLKSKIFYKIYGYGLSVSWITILFELNDWPSTDNVMIVFSILGIVVSTILGLLERKEKKMIQFYFIRLLIPFIIILVILKENYL